MDGEVARAAYTAVFALSTVGCLAGVARVRTVGHPEVRDGLTGLLLTTAAWAGTELLRVYVTDISAGAALYLVGLGFGLATVGAWLYFASAAAGYTVHRDRTVQGGFLVGFAVLTLFKFLAPRGLYYTATPTMEPFLHVGITPGPVHWLASGLAYLLAGVGFYVLYGVVSRAGSHRGPLVGLLALTGAPVVATLAGTFTERIPALNYEPVGVALFALGSLYVFRESFLNVTTVGRHRLVDELDDPVFILDTDDVVREFNRAAADLADGVAAGVPFATLHGVPDLDTVLSDGGSLEWPTNENGLRYYLPAVLPVSVGGVSVGRAVVLRDVTGLERQRRDIDVHRAQLESLADSIAHEFRNGLGLVRGYARLGREAVADDDGRMTTEAFETIDRRAADLRASVEDLVRLAQYGQPVQRTESRRLSDLVSTVRGWNEHAGLAVETDEDGTIDADSTVLLRILHNCLRFAGQVGASDVRVGIIADGLSIRVDGRQLDPAERESALDFNTAGPGVSHGTTLPTAGALARAHGWSLRFAPPADGPPDGFEILVEGARTAPDRDPDTVVGSSD